MAILLVILLTVKHMKALTAINYVLVITIAAIPVGLPTVLSVTMAVGAKQLAKKQVFSVSLFACLFFLSCIRR